MLPLDDNTRSLDEAARTFIRKLDERLLDEDGNALHHPRIANCMHVVSAALVQQKKPRCPLCNRKIKTSQPNPLLEGIIEDYLNFRQLYFFVLSSQSKKDSISYKATGGREKQAKEQRKKCMENLLKCLRSQPMRPNKKISLGRLYSPHNTDIPKYVNEQRWLMRLDDVENFCEELRNKSHLNIEPSCILNGFEQPLEVKIIAYRQ